MLFTSYRWYLFILYDVIVFLFCFILLQTSWGTDVSVQGQILLLNLLRHRCFCAEVNYCWWTSWGTDVIVLRYFYLDFSSEMEDRTLSQMCGRLYLPKFLLRVGLLTLMYIASFIALAIFWPSLLIILKFSTVIVLPVIFWCYKLVMVLLNVLCTSLQKFYLTPQCTHHHIQSYHIWTSI